MQEGFSCSRSSSSWRLHEFCLGNGGNRSRRAWWAADEKIWNTFPLQWFISLWSISQVEVFPSSFKVDEKYARNLQYEGYALGRSVEMGVVCGCVRLIWLNWMLDPIFKKSWFVKDWLIVWGKAIFVFLLFCITFTYSWTLYFIQWIHQISDVLISKSALLIRIKIPQSIHTHKHTLPLNFMSVATALSQPNHNTVPEPTGNWNWIPSVWICWTPTRGNLL